MKLLNWLTLKHLFMNKKRIIHRAIPLFMAIAAMFSACSVEVDTPDEQTVPGTTAQNTTNVADTTLEADAANGSKLDVVDYSAEPVIWGPGNIKDHARPADPEKLQNKYSEMSAQWLLPEDKTICLTFDEGYENGYTAQILDTLKEKQVSAVFFCTLDYIDGNPELVQRMIDEGHVVANHSASHASTPTLTAEEVAQEIQEVHQVVQEEFGYTMTLFRNPEGSFCERDLAIAQALGYESVFWSFAYVDWVVDDQPDPAESLTRLVEAVHPGAIYLLHPVSSTNAAILGDFIDQARAQGYEFTSEITPLET